MRVKICGIRTEKDLNVAIRSGADALGFLVGQMHPSSSFIIPSTAARFVSMIPPFITPVLVTHYNDADEIQDIVFKTGINTIQLHGFPKISEIREIRKKLPSAILILAVYLDSSLFPFDMNEMKSLINAFHLDTRDYATGRVGGTGMVHDWNLSAQFVEQSSLPVILAGGLSPENVQSAIQKVKPFAVDANSLLKNNQGECEIEKCSKFVHLAKNGDIPSFLFDFK